MAGGHDCKGGGGRTEANARVGEGIGCGMRVVMAGLRDLAAGGEGSRVGDLT